MFKELFKKKNTKLSKNVEEDAKFFNGKMIRPKGLGDEFKEIYGIEKADNKSTEDVKNYFKEKYNATSHSLDKKSYESIFKLGKDTVKFIYEAGKKPFIQYYIESPDWDNKQGLAPDLKTHITGYN